LQDIIAEDLSTHGSMFVPVAGSDKTTVSVTTGNQEYHPIYMSPGNITNIAHRAHGSAFLPVAFLPIPKGIIVFITTFSNPIEFTLQLARSISQRCHSRNFADKCIMPTLHASLHPSKQE
jgi:Plavaka transposase